MNIGKFTSINYVGCGNFGDVYHVLDTLLNVERAIKIVRVSDPKQFMDAINEAQILEKCRNNHIVDIKEINIYDISGNRCPCIITEYLSNGSAQLYLERNFVTVHKAIKIITDILYGLEHAQEHGIFHRDIKPANILLRRSGVFIAKHYVRQHETLRYRNATATLHNARAHNGLFSACA